MYLSNIIRPMSYPSSNPGELKSKAFIQENVPFTSSVLWTAGLMKIPYFMNWSPGPFPSYIQDVNFPSLDGIPQWPLLASNVKEFILPIRAPLHRLFLQGPHLVHSHPCIYVKGIARWYEVPVIMNFSCGPKSSPNQGFIVVSNDFLSTSSCLA